MGNTKTYIIGQDKNYEGKLSKTVVDNVIKNFKRVFEEYSRSKKIIEAFELNGGEGMTSGAAESWKEFKKWCRKNKVDAIYNTSSDIDKIIQSLRVRVDNKNKN